MKYLLDSDVLIQAKNAHYAPAFCPAFWHWLVKANAKGEVFSVLRVCQELRAGNDDLSTWAAENESTFFLPPASTFSKSMTKVSSWVQGRSYTPGAISAFLAAADCYLVSHAEAGGWTVVTHETREPNRRSRVKIPDVCAQFGIPCSTPWKMLRERGAKFVL